MAEKESSGSRALWIVVIVGFLTILLIVATLAVYFYLQYQKTQKILQSPSVAAVQESNDLVQKVGVLMELPKGEQPTIATVSDAKKLANDPFFAHARNGDKVLIYANAKKAILYDPFANKIVEVGPVNVGAPSPTPILETKGKATPTSTPLISPTTTLQ